VCLPRLTPFFLDVRACWLRLAFGSIGSHRDIVQEPSRRPGGTEEDTEGQSTKFGVSPEGTEDEDTEGHRRKS
jgi:hypothetical protein